jgi:5-methylthioadenosine/S-adenosylhomocysteine deaminase
MPLTRRKLLGRMGAVALAAAAAPSFATSIQRKRADRDADYLIRGGTVVSVDPHIGTQHGCDVLIRNGEIIAVGRDLPARGIRHIDAKRMIVMPGFVDTHWHLWSSLGRSFIADGFEYFAAKRHVAHHYTPADFRRSNRLALAEAIHAGITTVHNFAHNVRGPDYADAELETHAACGLRARYSYGHRDGMSRDQMMDFADIDRVRAQWFGADSPFAGRVALGAALRGPGASSTFEAELTAARTRGLPVALHAGQGANPISAVDLHERGLLDRNMLLIHFLRATAADRQSMVAAGASLSLSMHSELRLGVAGDVRDQLLRMLAAGVNVAFSIDANSLAPIDMFEAMRLAWSIGIPWQDTSSAQYAPLTFKQVMAIATLNGARALGMEHITGSLSPGKRADIVLIRKDDLNLVPVVEPESALVLHGAPENVDTVLVDGRVLKRDGRIVGLDIERIKREAAAAAQELRERAGESGG